MKASKNLYVVAIIDKDMSPTSYAFISEEGFNQADSNSSYMEEFSDMLLDVVDDENGMVFLDKEGNKLTFGYDTDENGANTLPQKIIKLNELGYNIKGVVDAFII